MTYPITKQQTPSISSIWKNRRRKKREQRTNQRRKTFISMSSKYRKTTMSTGIRCGQRFTKRMNMKSRRRSRWSFFLNSIFILLQYHPDPQSKTTHKEKNKNMLCLLLQTKETKRKLVEKLTLGSGTKVTCANTSSVSGSAYKKIYKN